MSRRNGHRSPKVNGQDSAEARPDTPGEIQAVSFGSPFFRESWSNGSAMSWQQFVARWENKFTAPTGPTAKGR